MKSLMFRLANTLTGMSTSLMDSTSSGEETGETVLNTAYQQFKSVVGTILPVLLGVVLVIGMFYGISLGIKFAKAESTDDREKVKGQLVNLCIGIGVAAVILVVCLVLVNQDVFAKMSWFTSSDQ